VQPVILDAVIERLAAVRHARKPGSSEGVDVQDSILKRAHKKRAEKSHIPGQTHQQNVAPPQFGLRSRGRALLAFDLCD